MFDTSFGSHPNMPAGLQIQYTDCVCRMELQPPADMLQDFLAECELKLLQFAPQNISNMLWACATLGVSPGALAAQACYNVT